MNVNRCVVEHVHASDCTSLISYVRNRSIWISKMIVHQLSSAQAYKLFKVCVRRVGMHLNGHVQGLQCKNNGPRCVNHGLYPLAQYTFTQGTSVSYRLPLYNNHSLLQIKHSICETAG